MKDETRNLVTLLAACAITGIGTVVGLDAITDMSSGIIGSMNINMGNSIQLAVGTGVFTYGVGLLGQYIKHC